MVGDILQPTHLLFVLIVALLVLGPKRLPEVGRALGRGLRDFRSAISGEEMPEHTIPPAGPPATSEQPASASDRPPATSESPASASDRPPATSDAPSSAPSDTAETEVQAPKETAEPVGSSASADSST